jgi:hypothetical protein
VRFERLQLYLRAITVITLQLQLALASCNVNRLNPNYKYFYGTSGCHSWMDVYGCIVDNNFNSIGNPS